MPKNNILKIVILLLLGGVAALLLAGCGGGSDGGSDPQEILDQTFSGGEEVSSGVLDLAIEAAAGGDGGGSLNGSLQGPFETRADDELPLLDVDASLQVDAEGQGDTDFEGGLTITPDAAFVATGGQEYEVDSATFSTFSQLFAQSASAQDQEGEEGAAIFEQLGIDPSTWLTDVSNEGTEEIDGVETVHITGTADVGKIVEDAQAVDPTGSALGAGASGELADSVKSASIDVFSGADDNILRRLDLAVEVEDPESGDTLTLSLSFGISGVNEEQQIEAPADAKPIEELIPGGLAAIAAGGLGGLGGGADVGGGSGGAAPGGGSGGAGAGGAGSQEYLQCTSQAKTPEEFADCANLAP